MAQPDFKSIATAEDVDVSAIRAALKGLRAAGLKEDDINSAVYNLLKPSQCEGCQKVWLKSYCRSLPDWEETSHRRGRRLELGAVKKFLEEAGWTRQQSYCEDCLLQHAGPLGTKVATMKAPEMKRFTQVFLLRIKARFSVSGERFRDTNEYKFFVLFTKAFFDGIPAKNRKSFGLLTEVMHKLELL